MTKEHYFILTEAAAMIPLLQRILVDVREARSRLSSIERARQRGGNDERRRSELDEQWRHWRERLTACLAEADELGVEITPSIRCEALFPFEHKWTGPSGDGKIRPAYFIYSDDQPTITEWCFSGWPNDRRKVWPHWWQTYRPGQKRTA